MSDLEWFRKAATQAKISVGPSLAAFLRQDNHALGQWFFLSERGARNNLLKQRSLYSNRDVLPFARRLDRDDVAVVVLRDAAHPYGSVLILHDDAIPGTEIELELGSIDEWFQHAQEEMSKEQHEPAGFAEPHDDRPA